MAKVGVPIPEHAVMRTSFCSPGEQVAASSSGTYLANSLNLIVSGVKRKGGGAD